MAGFDLKEGTYEAGGTMRHIPYGYRIENGRAVIDEEQAATVRDFFRTIFPAWRLCPPPRKSD